MLLMRLNACRLYCTVKPSRIFESKKRLIPEKPVKSRIDPAKLPPATKIDRDTIALLERLSLVDCANKEGIETLEKAIEFADQIQQVNTENTEPLVSVLEDKPLRVREDVVCEGNCREDILQNAQLCEEDYFVAPPGNIPLAPRHNPLFEQSKDDAETNHGSVIESTGLLLLENLRNEWFNDVVINKDIPCFMSANDLQETFQYAKAACSEVVPFALAHTVNVDKVEQERNELISGFEDFGLSKTIHRFIVFVSPSNSTHLFHQLQGQRRIWWRKFAASPGRYTLTDLQANSENQTVHIQAKYPWGQQIVETLQLDSKIADFTPDQLSVKNGRKQVTAHTITSEICSETMFLNTICDAYEEQSYQGQKREILRLHRKLAPYRISFAIPIAQKSVVDELKDLALYLCRQLRGDHVSCLLLPVSSKNTLEAQWKQYDQMGIPYNVLLNEKTLKDGVALLRSRDTTLKEQVHISNLRTYVQQLFKHY